MTKKVIVAGHICLDITPLFPEQKVENIADFLLPGRSIETKNVDVHTGGAVANTGLAMKILGADVSLMGKVGDDPFGEMVLSILKKYDADQGMIVAQGEATSSSIVLAIPGIDRMFLHNPGANHTFQPEDIPEKDLEKAALFHYGYPSVMASMYRNEGSGLVRMMKKVKEAGVATSLDLAVVDENSEAGREDWNKILKKVIPYVDFFVPSVEELCFMLDRKLFAQWRERAKGKEITSVLDIENDVKPLADLCMSYGAKVLLIKCGATGMYYRTAEKDVLQQVGARMELDLEQWADKEGFEKSFVPECVLSGTGAGDTSIAAFLTAVLEGSSPKEAVSLAAAEGASCVTAFDALGGIRTLNELREKIAAGWEKY